MLLTNTKKCFTELNTFSHLPSNLTFEKHYVMGWGSYYFNSDLKSYLSFRVALDQN